MRSAPARIPPGFSLALKGAALLARLRLHEGWDEARIRRFQERALRRLVAHSVAHVPYYRDLFGRLGLRPGDIRTREDLARLPVLTRAHLREHEHSLLSGIAPRESLIPARSSGSTGEPITAWLGPEEFALSWGFFAYGMLRAGARLTDRYAMIEFPRPSGRKKPMLFERMGLFRTTVLSIVDPMDHTLERLEALRPQVLFGFPSWLHLMAHRAERRGTTLRPRMVVTHGEMLQPGTRALIERALHCRVSNTYGAAEAFRIACECPHGQLHILPDSVIVEVDPGSRGADGGGDVLVTPLYMKSMPLLRYRLGDQVRLGTAPCACGSRFQVIEEILGRTDDWITLPGGRMITARHIRPGRIASLPGVIQFRIYQRAPDRFEVLLLADDACGPETERGIEAVILDACKPTPVRVTVRRVEEFPRGAAGKHRAVVSEVEGFAD